MKTMVAVFLLILSGCSVQIDAHEVKYINDQCVDHGGVSTILAWSGVSTMMATCFDGVPVNTKNMIGYTSGSGQ